MADKKSSLVQLGQALLDEANQSQKVTVVATTPGVQQEVDIAEIAGAAPSAANPLPVRLTDGSGFYSANAGFILDGTNVTAEQDTATPADNRGSPVVILPGQGQAPISPATSGNQVSTNTKLDTLISQTDGVEGSLSSIDTKTPALGQALEAASVPVVLPATQIATLTPQTDALTDAQLRASAVPVSAASLPLPTGAATETTLAGVLADTADIEIAVESIDTKTPALVGGRVPVDGSGVTQPISATSLPLPTGASTEAKQDTANTSLSNIDASLNDIEAVIEVVGHGSPVTAQRVAAEVGSNGAVNSSGNPLYVAQSASAWPVRLQDGAGNPIDSQSGALSVQLESLNANTIPGNYGTPTNGSPRVAAMLGVGSTAVGTSNPVPTRAESIADVFVTGNITASAQSVVVNTEGKSSVSIAVTGTFTGTIGLEGTIDGTNWSIVEFQTTFFSNGSLQSLLNTNTQYFTPVAGYKQIRAYAYSFTSGTATIALNASVGTPPFQFSFEQGGVLRAATIINNAAVSSSNPFLVSEVAGTPVQLVSPTQLPYFQDFSTSSLTTSYTQIKASSVFMVRAFMTNNSSTPIFIGVGSIGNEVVRYILMPGENAANIPILTSERIAIRTQSGTLTSGQFSFNAFS